MAEPIGSGNRTSSGPQDFDREPGTCVDCGFHHAKWKCYFLPGAVGRLQESIARDQQRLTILERRLEHRQAAKLLNGRPLPRG